MTSKEGVRVVQRKPNFEYIQEIDNNWYYLDEMLRYSRPFETYDEAKEALKQYYSEAINGRQN